MLHLISLSLSLTHTHTQTHKHTHTHMVGLLWTRNRPVAEKKNITSSVYDCTVEDVEYIYNKLSIHIFNSKRRQRVIDVFYTFNSTVID